MTTVAGNGALDGERVRAVLDAMDGPRDEAKMLELYQGVMTKLEQQERWRARGRQVVQLASALAAAMTGAGAYRLLTR